jgi:hypothetical protein
MNMKISNFSTTQVASNFGSLSAMDQSPTKSSSSIPSAVQKKYDAAQVRLANAYAMPEGGFLNLLSQVREGEIQNARRAVVDMRQDFPGISSQSNGNAVPPEARKAYEMQLTRLADANAMPVGSGIFGFAIDNRREDARRDAKAAIAAMEKDFPGLVKPQNGFNLTSSNPSKTTLASPTTVAPANSATNVNSIDSSSAATTVGKPIDAATAEQAIGASGALGAYMHSNNIDVIDVNELYAIANNGTGQVPEDVQKAAAFMAKNPDVYKAIETNDVAGADGISARNNFDKAAQGLVAFNQPDAGSSAPASKLALSQQAKNASGTLAAYMRTDGIGGVDMNQLYAIANNSDRETSADVRNAAAFMLKNPDAYRAIETYDVAGVDGISGLSNFENMAMGKIKFDPSSSSAPTVATNAKPVQQTKTFTETSVVAPKLSPAQEAKRAAGTLAAYVRTDDVDIIDPNLLYALTINADKKASKDVQKAAAFMLTRPDTFKAVETSVWSVVDGRATAEDLNRAAQGLTKLS